MAMQQQQSQESQGWHPIRDAKTALAVISFVSHAIAYPVELFLRTGFGSQAAGLPAAAAFIVLPLWPGCYHNADPRPVLGFWALALLMQIRARWETSRMLARGAIIHSRYGGWPRLSRVFKRASELKLKGLYEPVCVFVAGGMLIDSNLPLGEYLIAAAISLIFNAVLGEAANHARAREMNDTMIEQQLLAERIRSMNGGKHR